MGSGDAASGAEAIAVWTQAIATLVLVAVTVYYAIQNRTMARANEAANGIAKETLEELKAARVEGLRPHLAMSLEFFAPTYVKLRVTNLGGGAAAGLIANIQFERGDKSFQSRQAVIGLLVPSEHVEFALPRTEDGNSMTAGHFAQYFHTIEGTFTFSDVFGNPYSDTSAITDLPEWWSSVEESRRTFKEPADERIARSLSKLADAVTPVFKKWGQKPVTVTTLAAIRRERRTEIAEAEAHLAMLSALSIDSEQE